MKKEPCWDLSINTEPGDGNGNGGSAPNSTPRKRADLKKMAATKGGSNSDDEDDVTPSKKPRSTLDKVKGGRISKGRGKNGAAPSYVEIENEDEDAMDVKGDDEKMNFDNGQ